MKISLFIDCRATNFINSLSPKDPNIIEGVLNAAQAIRKNR